jgi:hypothetical protein
MSQHPGTLSETDGAQAPLDFNMETLQDLDLRDDWNVMGGAGVVAQPVQNPSGGRMTTSVQTGMSVGSGTSVILPGH